MYGNIKPWFTKKADRELYLECLSYSLSICRDVFRFVIYNVINVLVHVVLVSVSGGHCRHNGILFQAGEQLQMHVN